MARDRKPVNTAGAPARPGTSSASEDAALWQRFTENIEPLRHRPATPGQPAAKAVPKKPVRAARVPPVLPPAPMSRPTMPPEMVHGAAPGLDRRSAQRMRRGKVTIEARIDLHGMRQLAAKQALEDFIATSVSKARRCVLVITGKGLRPDGGVGVLRDAVPAWLNEPGFRRHVISFSYAHARDGGAGALYVMLRRPKGAGT